MRIGRISVNPRNTGALGVLVGFLADRLMLCLYVETRTNGIMNSTTGLHITIKVIWPVSREIAFVVVDL
jgi:hypothetical protein